MRPEAVRPRELSSCGASLAVLRDRVAPLRASNTIKTNAATTSTITSTTTMAHFLSLPERSGRERSPPT